ncbi:MAG: hypothetical protein KME35_01275 [Aphanocapsa sp. GSE-SYN-MK-11-07L]|jgi:hypothetical protein|nr:hypothetical protein [Aphanocapsa sp. GSE-SYN-MK-11-07L]
MIHFSWHDYLLAASAIAAIAGLGLLFERKQSESISERRATSETLLRMTFVYWIVYCLAVGLQRFDLPDINGLAVSLKLTALFSYFLTFSSLLCLPLHHFEARRQTQ